MKRPVICGCLIAAVIGGLVAVSAQQPTPQAPPSADPAQGRPAFKANVDLTRVDFLVTDKTGNLIGDLTQDDFIVREDGKEQPITMFEIVRAPAKTLVPREVSTILGSDVESNVGTEGGRIYLLVIDDAGMTPQRVLTVQAVAHEFIEEHLTDADQVAVIPLSGRRELIREFTRNRQSLLESIDRLAIGFGVPSDTAHYLTSLMTWLEEIEGRRKSVVYITEDVSAIVSAFSMELDKLLSTAARANVSFYIVDPIGVPTAPAKGGIKPVFVDDGAAYSESRKQGLRVLADATGGLALTTTSNDFSGALARIVEENSSYYLLGYPSTRAADGKFHKIEIEVKREKLRVRARSGYVAEKPTADRPRGDVTSTDSLAPFLSSPIAVPGLVLNVTAVPFRGPTKASSEVSVIVEVDAGKLRLTEDADVFRGLLDLQIVAVDQDGKVKGNEKASLTMKLAPVSRDRAESQGVRLLSSLVLKPGRYDLRVAAADASGSGVGGALHYGLTVPDFWREPLSMSGIAIAARSADDTLTSGGSTGRWEVAPLGMPTAVRSFDASDELRAAVEVYGTPTVDHPIEVTTTIRDPSGANVFERTQDVSSPATTATHPVMTAIELSDLVAGDYTLSVEAKTSSAPDTKVQRQIPFRIR